MQVTTGSAACDSDVIPTKFEGFNMEWLSDIAKELKGKTWVRTVYSISKKWN
jgi:hypothetical protein